MPRSKMSDEERKKRNAERSARWRAANPERAKEGVRKWTEAHKEEKRAMDQAYHEAHREKNNEYRRQWRLKNPEKQKAAQQRWYEENQDRVKDYRLQKKYGINLERYRLMLEQQGGGCAICGTKVPGGRGSRGYFHVDHSHETGQVRQLLCHGCNTGLGAFKEKAGLLRLAVLYLERHEHLFQAP